MIVAGSPISFLLTFVLVHVEQPCPHMDDAVACQCKLPVPLQGDLLILCISQVHQLTNLHRIAPPSTPQQQDFVLQSSVQLPRTEAEIAA